MRDRPLYGVGLGVVAVNQFEAFARLTSAHCPIRFERPQEAAASGSGSRSSRRARVRRGTTLGKIQTKPSTLKALHHAA